MFGFFEQHPHGNGMLERDKNLVLDYANLATRAHKVRRRRTLLVIGVAFVVINGVLLVPVVARVWNQHIHRGQVCIHIDSDPCIVNIMGTEYRIDRTQVVALPRGFRYQDIPLYSSSTTGGGGIQPVLTMDGSPVISIKPVNDRLNCWYFSSWRTGQTINIQAKWIAGTE